MAPRVKKADTAEQAPEVETTTTATETALESTAVEQAPEVETTATATEGDVDAPEQTLGEGETTATETEQAPTTAPEGETTATETEDEQQAPAFDGDIVARKEKVLATLPECVEAGHSWKFAGVSVVSSIKNPFEIIELIKERSSDLVGVIGRVRINRSVVQIDLENVGNRIQFLENIN